MDVDSEKELEQLKKLDQLRKLIQTILGSHWCLLIVIFILILAAVLTFVAMSVSHSPSRYLARLNLYYQPKQKGKVGQYDDKYVLGILRRQTTRMNFARRGDGKDSHRKQVSRRILITLDRKQPHNFSIMLFAASEAEAVEFVNEFALTCIQEYTRERTRDLRKWKEVLENERKGLQDKFRELNGQISKLTIPLHIISPEKDYERLRTQINDLQAAQTRLNYVLKNLNLRKKQLEKELSTVNPELLTHQQEIRSFLGGLEKLDKDIAQSAELYTEENPKMIALTTRRNALQKRLNIFLKSKRIESVDPLLIGRAEKASTELKNLQLEIDSKQGDLRVMEGELSGCHQRFRMLTEYQPKLQQLTLARNNIQESVHRLDESIAEINYILLMVKEDLFINEKARSAVGSKPFAKKKLAVCVFAAFAITCFFAALIVLAEFFFGRVANARELILYEEFHYLGVLPASEEMFNSEDCEKMAFNKLFHKFQAMGLHVIFTGALPGARIISQLFEFFEWNFAMSGHRMLIMDMVLAEEFDELADENQDTALITFSGGKCYLPLTSKKYLAPSELELLKNDFLILKKSYDYIFIRHSFTLRRSILFLEQIASLCDGALVAVGEGRTPRKSLRKLLSAQLRIKIPVMTILTDYFVKKLNKDLNLEAES